MKAMLKGIINYIEKELVAWRTKEKKINHGEMGAKYFAVKSFFFLTEKMNERTNEQTNDTKSHHPKLQNKTGRRLN